MPHRSQKSVGPRKLKRFKGGTFTRHDFIHMNENLAELDRPCRAIGRRKEHRSRNAGEQTVR